MKSTRNKSNIFPQNDPCVRCCYRKCVNACYVYLKLACMHKSSVNRVTVAASSRLPLSSTRHCLPFRSRAVAVEIIAFAVLCNAIVSRIEGFLWAAAGEGRRLLVLCGLRTLDVHEVYLNARSGTRSSVFSSRAEISRARAHSENFLWCLIIFGLETFPDAYIVTLLSSREKCLGGEIRRETRFAGSSSESHSLRSR